MSACAPTDRLMQTIVVTVPGVPEATARVILFNVIDEFLRRTSAWKIEVDVNLEGESPFVIPVPADAEIVRAMGATHNGVPVPQSTSGVIQSSTGTLEPELLLPDGDANFLPFATDIAPPSDLFSWSLFKPNYISVTNPPTSADAQYPLKVVVALSIAKSCLECECGDWQLDEWMFDMYFQDWLNGVLGNMFIMPAKPWSNPQLATYHLKRFRQSMGYRKQEAARGFNYNTPTWRFPGNWTR